ncbi:MAG: ABC transporter permease [Rhodanobacteraceae bacterium]
MRLPPMLASLTRHKLTVALMLVATAMTCAIICNVASMIANRLVLLNAPSGVDESSVVMLDSSQIDAIQTGEGGGVQDSQRARYQADVAALRTIAGVSSASVVNGLPLDGGSSFNVATIPVSGSAQGTSVSAFWGGEGELATLGLRLVSGRDFVASEYIPAEGGSGVSKVSACIVSRVLARRLFHDRQAVGQLVYQQQHPIRIVGVVEHLMGMNPRVGADDNEFAMLLPLEPDGDSATFVLRTAPQDRERVLKQASTVLNSHDQQRVLDDSVPFAQVRAKYFQRDTAMVGLLLASGLALLAVTAVGIAGLANFWVQQRTQSIGIRRALGATRADVLRYFLAENFLIASGGIAGGWLLTYALNLMLMKYYQLQVLSPAYLLIGAIAIWLIGQLAALGPALRAAAVPPAVATRSV